METTLRKRFLERDRDGTARSIARELTAEEREHAEGMRCFVRHPDAGGHCQRGAAMMVYGLLFCEVHGAEARAGALSELYEDAGDLLSLLDSPYLPTRNAETIHALRAATQDLDLGYRKADGEEDEVMRRAYPTIPERVDSATTDHDYSDMGFETPHEAFMHARRLVHKLMRLAYVDGADWLVEVLEYQREMASAQAAFASEDEDRRRFVT